MRIHNLAGSIFHRDFEPGLLIQFIYLFIYVLFDIFFSALLYLVIHALN